jgi:hypothetical protein
MTILKQMNYRQRRHSSFFVIMMFLVSCNWTNTNETKDSPDIEKWKLGWRIIGSSWDKNYQLGEQQFDSLLKINGFIETKFLVTGLDILSELDKKEKILSILSKQDQRTLEEICSKELFTKKLTDIQICKSIAKDEANKMFLQWCRDELV